MVYKIFQEREREKKKYLSQYFRDNDNTHTPKQQQIITIMIT